LCGFLVCQALNPILIAGMIPLFDFVIYPFFEARRFSLRPISRMVSGMVLSSVAFLLSGLLQQAIDGQGASNQPLSILWQVPQYVVMTAGEIMFSITSIEFAYSQAPDSMKAIVQAASLFTFSAGKAPCSSFMSPPVISHAWNMAKCGHPVIGLKHSTDR
jgi:dipeptide/tripeptide permease